MRWVLKSGSLTRAATESGTDLKLVDAGSPRITTHCLVSRIEPHLLFSAGFCSQWIIMRRHAASPSLFRSTVAKAPIGRRGTGLRAGCRCGLLQPAPRGGASTQRDLRSARVDPLLRGPDIAAHGLRHPLGFSHAGRGGWSRGYLLEGLILNAPAESEVRAKAEEILHHEGRRQ